MGGFIDWYARATELGLGFAMLPDVLLKRRIHRTNTGRERHETPGYTRIVKEGARPPPRIGAVSGWLPTPEQELLLQAALGRGDEVSRYWPEWRRRVDLDDVELASFRLLPLAYLNLREHGIEDPDLGRLKGVYRQAWARNQLQQQGLDEALRLLHGSGIETMLLKGSALLHGVYSSPAARTMEDLDVLVAPERARRAIDTLVASGWDIFPDEVIPDSRLPLMHAVHLRRSLAEWINIDLHRRAIAWRYHGDDDFWSASTPSR